MFLATEAGEVSKPALVDLYGDADATMFVKQEFANEGLKPTKKNYLQASIRVKLFSSPRGPTGFPLNLIVSNLHTKKHYDNKIT